MTIEEELRQQIKNATNLEQLAKPLQELLSGPYAVWPNGQLICIKVLVERVNDLRIEIRPNDHPPPHFHVLGQNFDVSFEIESGDLRKGRIDPSHFQKVKWWYTHAKPKLSEIWLKTRTG